jgi:hypothetical protein
MHRFNAGTPPIGAADFRTSGQPAVEMLLAGWQPTGRMDAAECSGLCQQGLISNNVTQAKEKRLRSLYPLDYYTTHNVELFPQND